MTSTPDARDGGSDPQVRTALQVRLGEALVQDAGLSRADLDRALALARTRRIRIGSALIELGLFSADDIAMALAQQHGVASVRDKHLQSIDPRARAMLAPATEERLGVVAVALARGEPPRLVVAMRDPRDTAAIAALEAETKLLIMPAAAAASRLDALIRDATAATLADLIRSSVPPRPAGVALTGASPLLDLDALPQRTTPWNAAARAAALEARRARASNPPPAAQGTPSAAAMAPRGAMPPQVAVPPRGTTPPPIAARDAASPASSPQFVVPAGGTRVAPAPPSRWRIAAMVAAAVIGLGGFGYAAYHLLSSPEPSTSTVAPATPR